MEDERLRILKLVAEGKASPEEAEALMDAVGREAHAGRQTGIPKFLRVTVDSAKGDKVNVRIPLALVRAGMKLSAVLPKDARESIEEKGIDLGALSSMESEALVEALMELQVDVDSSDGDIVKVFCE